MNYLDKLADIPKDKLLHSFYGTLIYAVLSLVNPAFALCSVIITAIAKEIYDEVSYGGFDFKDIIATVAIPSLLFINTLL